MTSHVPDIFVPIQNFTPKIRLIIEKFGIFPKIKKTCQSSSLLCTTSTCSTNANQNNFLFSATMTQTTDDHQSIVSESNSMHQSTRNNPPESNPEYMHNT